MPAATLHETGDGRLSRVRAWRAAHADLWNEWSAAWEAACGSPLRLAAMSEAMDGIAIPVAVHGEPFGVIGSDATCAPLEPWLRGVAAMIGAHLAAEDELITMTDELVDTYDQLTFLYEIARMLSATDDLADALGLLLGQARAIIGAEGSALIVERAEKPLLLLTDGAQRDDDFFTALHRAVSGQDRPLVANDAAAIAAAVGAAPRAITSVVAVPIVTAEGGATAVCVGATKPGGFTAGSRKLMQALAEQSIAVVARFALQEEQIRRSRIARDLELAAQIQTALLPGPFPVTPRVALAALMIPANEVGGDFYTHPDGRTEVGNAISLAIGDVAGKGVAAALITTMCLSAMRTEMRHIASPARALQTVSGFIVDELSRIDSFVTCALATYDTASRRLAYANAGHTAILHWSARGRALASLGATGLPLGIEIGIAIADAAVTLDPGDRVFLYTDGVTEAMAPDGALFGDERLHALIARHADLPIAALQAAILDAVRAFAPVQRDDITLIILEATE